MPEEEAAELPEIECCPEKGLPAGLGDVARAWAIINQTDLREEAEAKEKSDTDWLGKPFKPRINVKIVGFKGVGLTLGDVLDIPA